MRRAILVLFAAFVVAGLLVITASSPIAARSGESSTTCNSSSPCVLGSNAGSGAGVEGDTTAVSATAFRAGLIGFDNAPTYQMVPRNNIGAYGKSKFGAGVLGQSSNGFGLFATDSDVLIPAENRVRRSAALDFLCEGAFKAASCSVVGAESESARERSAVGLFESVNGIGLVGITDRASTNINYGAPGVFGDDVAQTSGTQNRGVEGDTQMGYGVLGFTFNRSSTSGVVRAGVAGIDDSLDSGIMNIGVEAFSHGTGVLAFTSAPLQQKGSTQAPALMAICGGGGPAIIANNGTGSPSGDIASLDCAGNLIVTGQVMENGSPLIKTGTPSGQQVVSYAGRSTRPTIEDDGEAQLVNGSAQVMIDSAFAATIDRRTPYLVFITPDGPNAGLYVTNKTQSGFAVRENSSGRSTLVFDYRIVATPADTPSRRLPSVSESLRDMRQPAVHKPVSPASFGAPKPISRP